MWGDLSYLTLMLIFAGIPAVVELVFGFHLFKSFHKGIVKTVLIFVAIIPFIDEVALVLGAWNYNPERNLRLIIISSPIETIIFALLTGLAISFAVTAWTFYEDNGKPIFRTSLHDVLHGTYAIGRRKIIKNRRNK
jgi:lycopene cyclase domain-containing protein